MFTRKIRKAPLFGVEFVYDMPCYSPIVGYRSRIVGDSGKRKLVFNRSAGFADLEVTVPCGQCIGCRIDKSRSWAIRCVHEAKMHHTNSFLTLTYSDDEVPRDYGLEKRELQLFFKRLREKIGKFRYYACGEYGDENRRPHYHVILFGYDFSADRKFHSKNSKGDLLYTSALLDCTWGKGFCLIGSFNYASAAYCARYAMKKQLGKNAHEHEHYCRFDPITGELFQVPPEFALMSRKPGIGASWFEKFHTDAFPSDFIVYQGKTHPVPKFYFDKLSIKNAEMASSIKDKRKKAIASTAADNTPDRLTAKEICKKAQLTQLKRSV